MRNTAVVTGGKPIEVLLQSISGISAINPLVAFYDIHGGKRRLFFYFFPDTTRDYLNTISGFTKLSPVDFQSYLLQLKLQIRLGIFELVQPFMLLCT
jgi:hypothetical protein